LDEGMNPLIISQRNPKNKLSILPQEYQQATELANYLIDDKDYRVDKKERNL
jgi:hypothetical protein